MSPRRNVVRSEASYWWRTNVVAGAILHRLMLLFIAVPVLLVAKGYYLASLLVFGLMVPYGLLLEHLAARAVSNFVQTHPEALVEFEETGVIPGIDPEQNPGGQP